MMRMVDLRGSGAVGPRQPSAVGDRCAPPPIADVGVVGSAAEEQHVGVGGPTVGPVRAVVYLGMIARGNAIGAGAAAVARIADDALVGGGDAFLPAQIQ